MRTRIASSTAVVVLAAVAAGCGEQPTAYQIPVRVEALASKAHSLTNYHAHATGDQEVPAVETQAQGQLKMQLSKDGQSLKYKLIVANIENVFMAHLHILPGNGIVVWLYPSPPPAVPGGQLVSGRSDGVLAEGEIRAEFLIGDLEGSSTLQPLVDAIEAGNIYVNVHTSQNPRGEVRGQVE